MANLPLIIKDKPFKKNIKDDFYLLRFTMDFFEKKLFVMTPIKAASWIMDNLKKINGYDFSEGFEAKDEDECLVIYWDISDTWNAKVDAFRPMMEPQGDWPAGWWESESMTDWCKETIKSS